MDNDKAERIDRLISDLQVLVDETASSASASLDVECTWTLDDVQFQLAELFDKSGALAAVNVVVEGKLAGAVTRQSLERAGGTAAEGSPGSEMGAGERIQLPGISAQFRLLEFTCRSCKASAYRIHYDERSLPTCEHGRMELCR